MDGDGLADWSIALSRSASGREWLDVKVMRGGTALLGTDAVLRWWAVPGASFRFDAAPLIF